MDSFTAFNNRFKLINFLSSCCILLLVNISLSDSARAGTQSFRRSCDNIRVSKSNGQTKITAECDMGRSSDGRLLISHNPTQLIVPREGCADISNIRGELQCDGSEHPRGSWSQSCVDGRYIRYGVFQAICAPRGTTEPSIYTSIDVYACPSFNIENINGRLQCH
jgi:hypothetical protein